MDPDSNLPVLCLAGGEGDVERPKCAQAKTSEATRDRGTLLVFRIGFEFELLPLRLLDVAVVLLLVVQVRIATVDVHAEAGLVAVLPGPIGNHLTGLRENRGSRRIPCDSIKETPRRGDGGAKVCRGVGEEGGESAQEDLISHAINKKYSISFCLSFSFESKDDTHHEP